MFGAWKIPKNYQKAQCELKCQAVSQLDKVVVLHSMNMFDDLTCKGLWAPPLQNSGNSWKLKQNNHFTPDSIQNHLYTWANKK